MEEKIRKGEHKRYRENLMYQIFNRYRSRGSFDGMVESILQEGLIQSYDVKVLYNAIEKKYPSLDIIKPDSKDFYETNFDYKAYSFAVAIKTIEYSEEFLSEFKKFIDVYGYYVVKRTDIGDEYIISIEPKAPIIINDILKKQGIGKFYHISHRSNYNNINKIGLAPRGTESTFYHPDDRIYLIMADISKVKAFVFSLARDKGKEPSEFLIYETPFDDGYKYYLDDTATIRSKDIYACFVLKNVPPNKLKLVK